MATTEVPVLIVGGGGCGLSLSIFLSDLGVGHLLAERHPGTSTLPKAHYLNQRTMEVFRQHGVDAEVAAAGAPLDKFGRVRWLTSLAGPGPLDGRKLFELDAFGGGGLRDTYAKDSPVLSTNLPQLRLEPLLRRQAEARAPGQVRFGHELVGFEAGGERVIAELRDLGTGASHTVVARYLVAADGGRTAGPRLGVNMEGPTGLADVTTAHFSADLSRWHDDRSLITWLVNPYRADLTGAALVQMGPTWGRHSEEWGLHFAFPPDDPARLDETLVVPRIRELLGLPDLDLELHQVSHWILEAVLADRYRAGRVLLAGDAVHRHPPATGLGLNMAIQDAHNLAWKLAAVLSAQAGEGLLDSYEVERRPVGRHNVDWAMFASNNHQVIMEAAIGLGPHLPPQMRTPMFGAYFEDSPAGEAVRARAAEMFGTHRAECQAHDVEIGVAYPSGALVPDGSEPPPRAPLRDAHHPSTRPGARLPHAWIEGPEGRLSTHDLVRGSGCFALLTGPAGSRWRDAAALVADKLGVTVTTAVIGPGGEWADPTGRWAEVRDVGDGGAVLVRPDHHVAWRSRGPAEQPAEALARALQEVLAR